MQRRQSYSYKAIRKRASKARKHTGEAASANRMKTHRTSAAVSVQEKQEGSQTTPVKKEGFFRSVIRKPWGLAACVLVVLLAGWGIVEGVLWGVREARAASAVVDAYEVSFGDRLLGAVEDADMPEQVLKEIEQEMVSDCGMPVTAKQAFSFEPVKISSYNLASREDVEKAIRGFIDVRVEAACIEVDGCAVAALRSEEEALSVLDRILQPYRDAAQEREITQIGFVEDVQIVTKAVEDTDVTDPEAAYTLLALGTNEKNIYVCTAEDTLSSVSETQGYCFDDIRCANPALAMSNVLHVGMELNLIHPVNLVNVRCVETVTSEEPIEFETITREDSSMYKNQTKVVQAGETGTRTVVKKVTRVNGSESASEVLSEEVTKEPKDKIIAKGTKKVPATSTGSGSTASGFMTPTSGYVSSPYGYRWGRLHAGVDIANAKGTPIYASKAGTVIRSSWYGGYGNCVDIDHGDGVVTRYGHCSTLKVSVGQKVSQGQLIALMGSTGNSTGPHLHFEIRINGSTINPQNKISI